MASQRWDLCELCAEAALGKHKGSFLSDPGPRTLGGSQRAVWALVCSAVLLPAASPGEPD